MCNPDYFSVVKHIVFKGELGMMIFTKQIELSLKTNDWTDI